MRAAVMYSFLGGLYDIILYVARHRQSSEGGCKNASARASIPAAGVRGWMSVDVI